MFIEICPRILEKLVSGKSVPLPSQSIPRRIPPKVNAWYSSLYGSRSRRNHTLKSCNSLLSAKVAEVTEVAAQLLAEAVGIPLSPDTVQPTLKGIPGAERSRPPTSAGLAESERTV